VIDGMKDVPHVMANYENPWETFDAYLKESNVEPEEASGLMFYYYLLDCVQKNKRIVEHIDINMTSLSVPASKVKFSIQPEAVSDLEVGEETLLKTREVLKNFTQEYGQFMHVSSYSSMWPYYEMVGITFKETVENLLTSALAVMIVLAVMLPLFFLAMYEKDGQPLEVVAKHFYEAKFKRPKTRPYKTKNYCALLVQQADVEMEVNRIVQNGKKQERQSGAGISIAAEMTRQRSFL